MCILREQCKQLSIQCLFTKKGHGENQVTLRKRDNNILREIRDI